MLLVLKFFLLQLLKKLTELHHVHFEQNILTFYLCKIQSYNADPSKKNRYSFIYLNFLSSCLVLQPTSIIRWIIPTIFQIFSLKGAKDRARRLTQRTEQDFWRKGLSVCCPYCGDHIRRDLGWNIPIEKEGIEKGQTFALQQTPYIGTTQRYIAMVLSYT